MCVIVFVAGGPMANMKKVELTPVVPTDVSHHRELPAGHYSVMLTGFRQNVCLIKESGGNLFLINWLGKGQMLGNFIVLESGELEYEDPNDRPKP